MWPSAARFLVLFCLLLVPDPVTSLMSYLVRPYHWFDALQTSAGSNTIGHKLTLASKLLGMITAGATSTGHATPPQSAPLPIVYNMPVLPAPAIPYYIPSAGYPLVLPLVNDRTQIMSSSPGRVAAISQHQFALPVGSSSVVSHISTSNATPKTIRSTPTHIIKDDGNNKQNSKHTFKPTQPSTAERYVTMVDVTQTVVQQPDLPTTPSQPTETPTSVSQALLATSPQSDSTTRIETATRSLNEVSSATTTLMPSHLTLVPLSDMTTMSEMQPATVNTRYGYQSLGQIMELERHQNQHSTQERTTIQPAQVPSTTIYPLENSRQAKRLFISHSIEDAFLDIYENDNLRCINKMICEIAANPNSFGDYGEQVNSFFKNYVPPDRLSPSVGYKMAASLGSITRNSSACASRYQECEFDSHALAAIAIEHT